MRPSRQQLRKRKGSVLVESALVLLIFVFTLIGIVDFAQILHIHQSLMERVRFAARTAVVGPVDADEIRELILYGRTLGPDTDPNHPPAGFLNLRPEHIQVTVTDRTYNEHRLIVEVRNLPVKMFSPWLPGEGRNLPVRLTVPLEEP
jgi:hypothetical protein